MRNSATLILLLLLLLVRPLAQAGEPSLGARLEKLVPRAAGVALVEVVQVKDVDGRPGDGPLSTDVRLRILRGTGETRVYVAIIKARGGHQARDTPPFKPYGPVKFDTFKKGERYWVAFASPYDWKRCPQGVVNSWGEKDGPKVLEEAIAADHYAHRPFHDPATGLTFSYREPKDKKGWRVRMERDFKLLWEVDLPGEKFAHAYAEWRFLNRSQMPSNLGYDRDNRSGMYLFAETVTRLEDGNAFQVRAGKHKLKYSLNADTGKTAGIWVSRFESTWPSDPAVIQYFDLQTGKVRREERYDFLEKGGLAVGSKAEQWLRKIERNYDASTGKLQAEAVFHCVGSTFVPIKK